MTTTVRIALHAPPGEASAWMQAAAAIEALLDNAVRLPVELYESANAAASSGAPVLGFSLAGALAPAEDVEPFAAAWHARAARLAAGPLASGDVAFVSTILRHLPAGGPAAMARLRRLNLLAAKLSQAHGLLVLDLDRALAHRGALALGTDAFLAGQAGQLAAAQVIGGALLADGLFRFVDDAALDAAIATHAAGQDAALARLTVPPELVPRRTTRVGKRQQVSYSIRQQFDDRGLAGLWRDFRAGRIGPAALARGIWRRVTERFERVCE